MKEINFQTIEEHLFFNKELQKKLPEFKDIFQQWANGIRNPLFSQLAQKAKIEMLEKIDQSHIQIMEDYFQEPVRIQEINSKLTHHVTTKIEDVDCFLMDYKNIDDNILISRSKDSIHLTFWR